MNNIFIKIICVLITVQSVEADYIKVQPNKRIMQNGKSYDLQGIQCHDGRNFVTVREVNAPVGQGIGVLNQQGFPEYFKSTQAVLPTDVGFKFCGGNFKGYHW